MGEGCVNRSKVLRDFAKERLSRSKNTVRTWGHHRLRDFAKERLTRSKNARDFAKERLN